METVTSADGTAIAVERVGSGPPLVCIHGTSATRDAWRGVATRLSGVECLFYDRRGRGESGDADDYSLAREVADARAVVEHARDSGPVSVFGHSFGGIVAFELAREPGLTREPAGEREPAGDRDSAGGREPASEREPALDRLVLYEPPVLTGDSPEYGQGFADRLRTLLGESGPDAVYRAFHFVPDDADLEPDAWADNPPARTIVREVDAVTAYDVPDAVDVSTPTRCLYGTETEAVLRDSTVAVGDAFPDGELLALEGVGHNAIGTDPAAVTARLDDFLPP